MNQPLPTFDDGMTPLQRWRRAALSWNGLITLVTVIVAALILNPIVRWALVDAVWSGSVEACRAPGAGACWAFVGEKMRFMVFGFYPAEQQWRPLVVMLLFVSLATASCFRPFWRRETVAAWGLNLSVMFALMIGGDWPYRILVLIAFAVWMIFSRGQRSPTIRAGGTLTAIVGAAALLAYPLAWTTLVLLAAGLAVMHGRRIVSRPRTTVLILAAVVGIFLAVAASAGLSYQRTGTWSGLPLTIWLSMVGMLCAFPLAVLLAVGRRARLPLVRAICIGIIESVRGVPLITLLFMAAFLLPIVLDNDAFDKLARIQIILILFIACYLAEIIRGGLQAIPKGQFEAAAAAGLRFWPSMLLVILPQVFRIAIPSIINLTINIFKDTSLVLIVGLFDFLQAVRASMADSKWLGISTEGYVFAALVYFLFCFSASRLSLMIERKLKVSHNT